MARVFRVKKSACNPVPFAVDRSLYGDANHPKSFMRHRIANVRNLHRRDLKAHFGCVNAVEFSNKGGRYIASGGDDRRVLLWDVEKTISNIGMPTVMQGEHNSNIFSLAFDMDDTKVFSGGNDEQVVVHDLTTGNLLDVFHHDDAVYGLSTDPGNSNIFASACDDGRILIYDIRETSSDPLCLAQYGSSMHAVMYNPAEPLFLATANAKEGVGLWDIRKPKVSLMRYGGSNVHQSCMNVRINLRGKYILALRRRLPPVLYDLAHSQPLCEFDHEGYYNSCTMKSCCFAGENDEYVLSGSDDFNLYMWKIPETLNTRTVVEDAHMILKGHRSIVNQVRYNKDHSIVISSGVEKIIKMWSSFKLPVPGEEEKLDEARQYVEEERPVYTHDEYINLVLRSGHLLSHDYSQQSTEEDPRMLAFFDSLVQREMEHWSSEELSSPEDEIFDSIVLVGRADGRPVPATRNHSDSSDSSSSSRSSAEEEDEDEDRASQDLPAVPGSSDSEDDEGNHLNPLMLALASVTGSQSRGRGQLSLDDDDDDDDDGDDDGTTEQDRPARKSEQSGLSLLQPTRLTIGEIIAQNRKVFQKAQLMRKFDRRKRRQTMARGATANLSFTVVENTSETEDSDTNQASERNAVLRSRDRKRKHSPTRSSNESLLSGQRNSASSSAVEPQPLNEKAKLKLRRLHTLRTRIEKGDSDSSDTDSSSPDRAKTRRRESSGQKNCHSSDNVPQNAMESDGEQKEDDSLQPWSNGCQEPGPSGWVPCSSKSSSSQSSPVSSAANSSHRDPVVCSTSRAVGTHRRDRSSSHCSQGKREAQDDSARPAGRKENGLQNSSEGAGCCAAEEDSVCWVRDLPTVRDLERSRREDKLKNLSSSDVRRLEHGARKSDKHEELEDEEPCPDPNQQGASRFKRRREHNHRHYRSHSFQQPHNGDNDDDDL